MANDLADETRFRSFAERYVIERASTFRVGGVDEMEDAWNAVARAKTIYNHIREKALRVSPDAADDADPLGSNAAYAAAKAKITATVNPKPARVYPKSAKNWLKPRSTP